LASKPTNQEEP